MSGWQPIETAPKDGSYILLGFMPNQHLPPEVPRMAIGRWTDVSVHESLSGAKLRDEWVWLVDSLLYRRDPTHWRPAPEGPR
jgi:hypothetical protein